MYFIAHFKGYQGKDQGQGASIDEVHISPESEAPYIMT